MTGPLLQAGIGRSRLVAEALTARVAQTFPRRAGPGNSVSLRSAKRQERVSPSRLHIVQNQMILLAWWFPI